MEVGYLEDHPFFFAQHIRSHSFELNQSVNRQTVEDYDVDGSPSSSVFSSSSTSSPDISASISFDEEIMELQQLGGQYLGQSLKRKRGRPPKAKPVPSGSGDVPFFLTEGDAVSPNSSEEVKVPRKRGRPPGTGKKQRLLAQLQMQQQLLQETSPELANAIAIDLALLQPQTPLVKRPRGRPRKNALPQPTSSDCLSGASSPSQVDSPIYSSSPSSTITPPPPEFLPSNFLYQQSTATIPTPTTTSSFPSDFQIAELVRKYVNEISASNDMDSFPTSSSSSSSLFNSLDEIVIRLEEHFGCNLNSRSRYIAEVYNVLCC